MIKVKSTKRNRVYIRGGENIKCLYCDKQFYRSPTRTTKFCSRECWRKYKNESRNLIAFACKQCERIYKKTPYYRGKTTFCSRRCKDLWLRGKPNLSAKLLDKSGSKNPNWKGGKYIDQAGYVQIRKPDHPRTSAGGYVAKQVLVMEKHLDRYLDPKKEVVHHKNRIKTDNRIENLQLMTPSEHMVLHSKLKD